MTTIQKTNKCSFVFKIFLFFNLLVCAIPGYSQQSGFTGSWTLQQRISLSGNDYANGVPNEINFSKNGEFVTISLLNMNQSRGFDTIVLKLNNSGQPTKSITPSKREKLSTIKWLESDKSFVQANEYTTPGRKESDQKNILTWTLASQGDTLTIVKVDENYINGETWSMKGIYKRK